MKNSSPFGPKTLVAAVLIAFAMVGTVLAANPTVTINTPSEGQHFNTATPTFSYTPGGDAAITEQYCNVNGPTYGPTSTFAQVTCPTSGPLQTLPEGAYYYSVMVVDADGATAVASRTFRIDLTAPTVSVVSPANGSTIVDETPTIAYNIVGAASGECSFDGAPFSACGPQFESPELTQGTHTLTVRATDTAGNVGQTTITFTIDLSAPLEDPLPPETANATPGKSKRSGQSLVVPIKIQILPSPDVSPIVSCKGKVSVSIKPKVRRAKTYRRVVNLKRSGKNCVASRSVRVPRKYKGKRATLRMTFKGNDYMSGISVVKTIRL